MNKQRRKQVNDLISKLENLKEEFELIQTDEQNYFDNIPENLQSSERYERAETAVEYLNSAVNTYDSLVDELYQILEEC